MNYKYEIVLKELNKNDKKNVKENIKENIKEKTIEVCKTKRNVNKIINDYINIKNIKNIKKSNENNFKDNFKDNFEVKEINECSISKSKKYKPKFKYVEDLKVGDTIIVQHLDDFPHTIKKFIKYAGPLNSVYCYVQFLNGEKTILQNNCFYKEIKNNI